MLAEAKKQSRQDRIQLWRENSPEGFLAWCEDIKPRIKQDDGYKPIVFTEKQLELIYKILEPAANTPTITKPKPVKKLTKRQLNARKARPAKKAIIKDVELPQIRESVWAHSMSLICQPRRHGKSSIMRLIVLWLTSTRTNITCQLLGSTESSTRRILFTPIRKIIENTPALLKIFPEKNMYVFELFSIDALGNTIQMSPGNNPSTAYGDKLDIIFADDLHSFPDMDSFDAFLSATLDSEASLVLLSSNADEKGGPVHLIEQAAETDETIFSDYTFYEDFEDYAEKAPAWISRKKAKREQKIKLPAAFSRDILGKRSDAKSSLFSSVHIEACKSPFKWPVDSIEAITQGRTYRIGLGLDRSKSLLGSATGGDNSIITIILKLASPQNEEPEFYILDQINCIPNTDNNIKRIILNAHKKYKLDNCCLEDYETLSLVPFLQSQKIPVEVVSPHSTRQNQVFPELSRICRENRLFFPKDAKKLISEMSTFSYHKAKRGEGFSFGHSMRNQKDDRIYSMAWSVYSLRSAILNLYSLKSIVCQSKRSSRKSCYLMGQGDMELYCSETCPAAQEVLEMYQQFQAYQMDSEILLPEFFHEYVKLTGARISQR